MTVLDLLLNYTGPTLTQKCNKFDVSLSNQTNDSQRKFTTTLCNSLLVMVTKIGRIRASSMAIFSKHNFLDCLETIDG